MRRPYRSTSPRRRSPVTLGHGSEELYVIDRRRSAAQPKRRLRRLLLPLLLLFAAVVYLLLHTPAQPSSHQELLIPSGSFRLAPLSQKVSLKLEHVVKRGEVLAVIFQEYGFDADDARKVHQAVTALENEPQASRIRAGQLLQFELAPDGRLAALRTELNDRRQLLIESQGEGAFVASISELNRRAQERVVNGSIQSSFAHAANAAGLPYAAIDELVDLFGDRISFHRDFRKNDEFSLVYRDTVLDDGTSLGTGTILAAALEVGGDIFCAVRYVGADGKARYFDQSGELLGAAFLRYPVKFSRISSSFSSSRFHPVLKRRRPHNGVDFAAPTGTPVRTVGDGVVEFAGRKGGNGNLVKIRHNSRYATAYAHLHSIPKGLRRGTRVQRGQVVGTVGMTGLATGPHLHYALYDNGRYVDPLKAKLPKIESLTKDQRIDPVYLRRVLYTLEHYRGRKIEIAELEPIQ